MESVNDLRNEPHSIKFLIDIEFLLDTRLPLIQDVLPGSVATALKNGYHTRLSDNFSVLVPNFDMEVYRKLWKERNVDLLMKSRVTTFPLILNYMLEKALLDRDATPMPGHIFLDINFGRYSGLPKEHYELWLEKFSDAIPTEVFLEYRFLTKEQLTPHYVNKNYQHVAIYEYADWIEHHFPLHLSQDTLRGMAMMHTDMHFPMLLKNNIRPEEFLEALAARGGDYFEDLGKSLAHIMYPRFIEPAVVSELHPSVVEHVTRSLFDMQAEKNKK